MSQAESKPILVVGGGVSGISTALELSEFGRPVILVEKEPFLGGKVAAFNKYFPKLCPPTCGLEINYKRLRKNANVTVHTMAQVTQVKGEAGSYEVTIEVQPRFVNDRCTACGDCAEACAAEREDTFNQGLGKTKAIYTAGNMAYPNRFVLDRAACAEGDLAKIKDACKFGAVDLDQTAQTLTEQVGAIVWATGWSSYDVSKVEYLGFGRLPDVITNLMMERLADNSGPTGGKLLRPSDGKEVESVAFVQCAGSRDVNHLAYCSGVCCLASLKQINYVRQAAPNAKIYMFHIDVRAGKYEEFYTRVCGEQNVEIIKGKVAGIFPEGDKLRLQVENIESGESLKVDVDLAVLATGIVPNTAELPFEGTRDDYGFLMLDPTSGMIPTGCVRRPADVSTVVQDATGAAMRALSL
ncbi:MAG: FAD-dependent oxidoreductase [bacterium]